MAVAPPRGLPPRPRRVRCATPEGTGAGGPSPGRRACGLARRRRRGRSATSSRPAELGGEPAAQAGAFTRAGEMAGAAGAHRARRRPVRVRRSLSTNRSGDTHAAARAASWLGFSEHTGGTNREGDRADGARLCRDRQETSPTPKSVCCSRGSAGALLCGRPGHAAEWIELALDSRPRRCNCRSVSSAAGRPRRASSRRVVPRRLAVSSSSRSRRRSCTTISRRGEHLYGNLSDLALQRDRYAELLALLEAMLLPRDGSATGVSSGSRSAR